MIKDASHHSGLIDIAGRQDPFRPFEWDTSYEEVKAESHQLKESDDTCGVLCIAAFTFH
ncbi:hypothetical protein KV564_26985 [Paenibacillus chitinolyticus]|nr:hypothetical protein [Paenibacillus chitinolyticus]